MPETRRHLFATTLGALGLFATRALFASANPQVRPEPKAQPYPNGRDPNTDTGLEGPSRINQKGIDHANRDKLRADVSKLYEMVGDFKAQVEKTDANSVLSLSLVKQAQQIEKLAKQIKDLTKG